MSQHETEGPGGEFAELPLRERLPEYGAVFGITFGVVVVLGALISVIFGPAFYITTGNLFLIVAVAMLATGGVQGGGYANLGMGSLGMMARRDTQGMDLEERLRKGLRPERNPRAFWQVVAGGVFLAIAVGFYALAP